jgi:imidazoleglycerol phosphate dehydratase HisB
MEVPMDTANSAAASDKMDLSGRKYTVFGSLALLAGPLLLTWEIVVIFTVDILNKHAALVGAK